MTRSNPSKADHGRKWPWLVLVATLLLLAGGGYWWLSQPAERRSGGDATQSPLVRATTLEATDHVILHQTGFVRASDAVEVVPQITERIVEIAPSFDVGQRVVQGTLLIRLDARVAEANLRTAEARLAQAEAALEETRISLERQQKLHVEQVISEAALDDAQVAQSRAEADVAMAEAELARAEIALNDTQLRAPFDAIVTRENASLGQLVQAGNSIGQLVATDHAEVRMGLLPSDLSVLGQAAAARGLSVTVSDPATGRTLRTGKVGAIVPAIDTATRTVTLIVDIPDPFAEGESSVRIGELVELSLRVPLGAPPALRVAAEALKGGDTLWRISDGQLERRDVYVLSRTDSTVTLRGEALSQGDKVLLSDLAAPADGDTVRVAADAMQVARGD
ncbi:efflux transporter (plasmid) [Dinoroseobacter shibae DFL 12 = DSM 16493]|jgi:RND family efflux transporter MFP subunit|uniref:Efflux transporter n=1 Tax=Dinoroseobacter shibae (strain DSM 16493 / NCIMB 14021 / DFL 12) TaxID=398580 RepID=A8LTR3_DINSH|nr:efflux RND transporter periplasmic adaptor subunit [Dinoroseobacter shibae]ABV95630.1 efflux transporter [Dinoroseobacter shibae DFL 12 = DSM 16493]URF48838.1 efflux RND transporter periplasmic adaptor subunit [Dinoroseobacter shibae]URF53150.1 efflux RND transporter periplasmic adaptor subunit [Dinoroseobacter shibae]